MNFQRYTFLETNELWEKLANVTTELANLHEELAMIEADNVRDKARVLQTCGETSSNARRDRVNMEVVEGPATAIQLTGHREALLEEQSFLARILDSRR